jgi:hypothetical protein
LPYCPRCGRQENPGVVTCTYCGSPMKPTTAPTEPSIWGIAPRGVSIIGWVQELMGAAAIGLGALGLLLGSVSSMGIVILGLAFLSAGAALFYLGYALRRARAWAWRMDIIVLAVISLAGVVAFVLGVYPIEDWALVMVMGIFVYYLLTPGVRRFFEDFEPGQVS